jgi:hexosaminidase
MVADPAKEGLSDFGARNIAGLEGTLFSETMRSPERLEYMMMPRLLALAERAWSPAPRDTEAEWARFANQLGKQVLPRLDAQMPDVNYRIAPPGLKIDKGAVWVNSQQPGFVLRYTTDGSVPDGQSKIVNGPITQKGTITVAAFNRNGRAGRASVIINP